MLLRATDPNDATYECECDITEGDIIEWLFLNSWNNKIGCTEKQAKRLLANLWNDNEIMRETLMDEYFNGSIEDDENFYDMMCERHYCEILEDGDCIEKPNGGDWAEGSD